MDRSKHVCALMAGWSGAREASLRSARACADVLQHEGFRVTRIDVGRDIANVLQTLKPDVVLNLVHGRPGDDGTLQGLLELIGIPDSHSGVLASALAIQALNARKVRRASGVPVSERSASAPAGRHLTGVVMGERALEVAEIPADAHPDDQANAIRPRLPAELLPNVYQHVRRLALAAHCALGSRGVSRTDFRWDDRLEEGTEGLICLRSTLSPA